MRSDRIETAFMPEPVAHPHLVVKRGHRGRHRFTMLAEGERIGGEIWLDAAAGGTDIPQAVVLAKIARLAAALQACVETRATSAQTVGARPERSRRSSHIDGSPARFQTVLGEGEHHGQV